MFTGYGLNQPASPSARDHDLAWDADLVRVDQPSSFARSRVHVDPSVVDLAGKRKVTCTVVPAGTTFGVADPTSPNPSPGDEQRRGLGTLVVDRDGPAPRVRRNGTGRRRERRRDGVGLGKTGGGGLGKAGNGGRGTPAGTYSSAAPFEMHWPSSLQSRPPALRTVPSSRSVNERAVDASEHARGGRRRPGQRVVQRRGRTLRRRAGPGIVLIGICHQHGAIRQQRLDVLKPVGPVRPGRLSECGPGSGGRVVHLSVDKCRECVIAKGSDHQYLAIGLQEGRRERGLRVHVRDRGPGPRDGVVYLGRVQHVVVVVDGP